MEGTGRHMLSDMSQTQEHSTGPHALETPAVRPTEGGSVCQECLMRQSLSMGRHKVLEVDVETMAPDMSCY